MNIVVLAGGISTERDVSLTSGNGVCKALQERGHHAVLLDVFLGYEGTEDIAEIFAQNKSLIQSDLGIGDSDPDLEQVKELRKDDASCFFGPRVIEICKAADIVYMGLHGADGENGKIQAAFDVLGVRYTGSGYLGSALAMDKGMAKKIFVTAGIPAPKGFSVTKEMVEETLMDVPYPCVVKPCCGGSSVGVSMASNEEEYRKALEVGFRFEEELLVEECIKGREFSAGVIDGKALPIIEIIPKEGFYDYKTKYQSGMATDVCPAELSKELTRQMQEYAVKVYEELKLGTYARIDFLLDANDQMYCLEANTLPGMTPTSLLPQEAKVLGIEYGELCEQIIGLSMERYEGKKKRNKSVNALYSAQDMRTVFTSPMEGMTLEKIAKACGGVCYGPSDACKKEVSMITTDSRQVTTDSLFVAIKGERVDGNRFVPQAYKDGALCCVSEEKPQDERYPYIVVKSCYQALKDMAKLYRSQMDIPVIGITGSVGKTSTKEMIASVLSERFHTLKTNGNFNNEVGVPLTLFRLRKEHEVAVVEMGISDFGEMTRLSDIVRPDCAVITNIGQCHLENLHDRDGVLKAKTEIFSSMNPQGRIYLNGDDDKLVTVTNSGDRKLVFFGIDNTSGIYAKDIVNLGLKGTKTVFVTPSGEFEVQIPVPGKHMVYNALAATAVALDLGMSIDQIQAGIAKFKPIGGHSSMIETKRYTILNDCYNANPVSMKAGIDVLSDALGRKAAIIGDMFELGKDEKELHYEIGTYAVQKGIDVLICIGSTLAKKYYEGASKQKKDQVYYFATVEEAVSALPKLLCDGDTILVKASHGMHLEKVVAVLEKM